MECHREGYLNPLFSSTTSCLSILTFSLFPDSFYDFKAVKRTEQKQTRQNISKGVRTGSLGPCLFGRLARLARPDSIACQNPELVLHPGAQVYYCSCQLAAPDRLRNWQNTQRQLNKTSQLVGPQRR